MSDAVFSAEYARELVEYATRGATFVSWCSDFEPSWAIMRAANTKRAGTSTARTGATDSNPKAKAALKLALFGESPRHSGRARGANER